jgi:hypothetical protein
MTKIKIKLSRQEYEAVSAIVTYCTKQAEVVDAFSLYEKEVLECIGQRLETKRWRLQKQYTFSLSIVEAVVFMKHVGTAMTQAGPYECAIYHTLYERQITPQTNRAVQMRMRF